jgi:hypothetical protein
MWRTWYLASLSPQHPSKVCIQWWLERLNMVELTKWTQNNSRWVYISSSWCFNLSHNWIWMIKTAHSWLTSNNIILILSRGHRQLCKGCTGHSHPLLQIIKAIRLSCCPGGVRQVRDSRKLCHKLLISSGVTSLSIWIRARILCSIISIKWWH